VFDTLRIFLFDLNVAGLIVDTAAVGTVAVALLFCRRNRRLQQKISEHQKTDERREASFQLLFDHNPVAMWLFDSETLGFIAVNDAAIALYGYSRERFLTMKVTDMRLEDNDSSSAFIHALPAAQSDDYVGAHRKADGSRIDVAVFARLLKYQGREARLVAINDVTERKRVADDLRQTKRFLDTVIDSVPLPIIVKTVKNGRFTLINKASEVLHGYAREEMIGKSLYDMLPQERANIIVAQDAECIAKDRPVVIGDHSIDTAKGVRLVTSKKVAISGNDGNPEFILTLIDDVTERRQAEARIAHMAHSDPLTDLANRVAFNERLAATLATAKNEQRKFALIYIDLDGFKEVNDKYGHATGDLLLCQVADRLREAAGDSFVARLGGDEFTIIAEEATQFEATALADRLLEAFALDFEVGDNRLWQALSIGVALYPEHGADPKALMHNADAALYGAKVEMPGTVCFFKPEMAAKLLDRTALQIELKSAIQHHELKLYYQPQRKMTGEIAGFEALARWNSAKRGMVPPSVFIPLAESSSLILVLGEWALREACREAASWRQPLNISVNVSPLQFRYGDLPRLVHTVLLETGLPANRLELEITESVLIGDFSRAVSILCRLKSLGVRIVLDDFGTGYSSLSYLRSFPFDKIKLDRSFISELEHDRQSIVIVRAVIGLSRSRYWPRVSRRRRNLRCSRKKAAIRCRAI
jgi:diguanylate cyclase (GGDEF)-like protein/PAS domain S-box-containing protein